MNTRIATSVIASAFLTGGGFAAQVLLKQINPGSAYYSEAAFSLFDDTPHRWAPGFRTASTVDAAFVVGWTSGNAGNDGFISRVSPAGSIEWTYTVRQIVGAASNHNWEINDVEVLGDRLYVCGTRTIGTQVAFVAKLTFEGVMEDYSLVEGVGGGVSGGTVNGRARGCSLAIGTNGSESVITMVGDVGGTTVRVLERQLLGAATVFGGLATDTGHVSQDNEDVFVVNFDADLRAVWGTTFGNTAGSIHSGAVAADNTGAIFVGMVAHENATQGSEATRTIFRGNGGRQAAYRPIGGGAEVTRDLGVSHNPAPDPYAHDFNPSTGSVGIIYRLQPQRSSGVTGHWDELKEITHHFFPCKLEGDEDGSHSRVTDLVYSNGALYAAGEWKFRLLPRSTTKTDYPLVVSKTGTGGLTNDIWVAKLSAGNLEATDWRIYGSTGEDYACDLTVGSDSSVYLAGIAGGALKTRSLDIETETDPSGPLASNSSKPHQFWQKLSAGNLGPVANWHVTPVEDQGASLAPPDVQRTSGVAVVGDKVIVTGAWASGTLAMGPDAETRKELFNGTPYFWTGFVGFLDEGGSFLEEVEVTINSEFGNPMPHSGTATFAAGQGNSITASVPQIVYEDAAETILDPDDSDLIRDSAVTRRICIGYQFRSSTENGTANTVTFAPQDDTELTFLWRTEHAIQIDADVDSVDGLTSKSAGDPTPEVNKHWIREGESFVASIDGEESDPAQAGTRWRSLGYAAEGSAAQAAGVVSGDWLRWAEPQNRQQTPEIIVNAPGKITWHWAKEYSVRQSANSSVAVDSPTLFWQRGLPGFVSQTGEFFEVTEPVTADTLTITFDSPPPPFIRVLAGNGPGEWQSQTIPVSAAPGDSVTLRFPPLAARIFRVAGVDAEVGGNYISNGSSTWGLWEGDRRTGTGEFWAPAGVDVALSSELIVDSGLSTLDLKGYNIGQGAVSPSAESGVDQKAITLVQPSSITWDYARAIYDETVTLGGFLTFSGVTGLDAGRINQNLAPLAGNVSSGPTGSSFGDMQVWDQVEGRLLALQPGTFTAEFQNTVAPDDPAQNIIVRMTVDWPAATDYTHIIETPPVPLDPSATDDTAFVRLAHSESLGSIGAGGFSAVEPGRSVLLFSQRNSGEANGDLERESLSVKVVNSINWETSAASAAPALSIIGDHLTSPDHDAAEVGHNGFVIQPLAPVNSDVYDPPTKAGPIIPVNGRRFLTGGGTDVRKGSVVEFEGPDDLLLDPASAVIAVNLYGDSDLDVNGVNFLSNRGLASVSAGGASVTVTASSWLDNYANPGPAFAGGGGSSASNLREIMRDIQFQLDPGVLTVEVTGLETGRPYHLQLLTNEGSGNDRRHDIAINGELVADNYTSHGDSSAHAWTVSNSFAYTVEYVADVDGKITIEIARDLGGNPPLGGTDPNPLLNGIVVHEADQASVDHKFAVAWYEVADGIRWPYKAVAYDPVWPNAPPRIVMASRLGTEGVSSFKLDPAGGLPTVASYGSFVPEPNPTWRAPDDGLAAVAEAYTKFHRVGLVPVINNDLLWVYTWGWAGKVFLYRGPFDPDRPLENLQSVATTVPNTWLSLGPGAAFAEYNIVFSQDGLEGGFGSVSAEVNGGAGVYAYQHGLRSPKFSDPEIYNQPNRAALGFNPNEEHALMASSFVDPTRSAAFALHKDLNWTDRDSSYTSLPYVLVQYEDRSDPLSPVAKMEVYAVVEEDPAIFDLRLPVFNRTYSYLYEGKAGSLLEPPYPVRSVIGASPVPSETEGLNIGDRISYYEDKNGLPWIVSGDTDTAADIEAAWHYPMRADFWHPTAAIGDAVPFGELTAARPRNIAYNTIWPDDVAVLKAGETLTFSGGEYASDNNMANVQPLGLPAAAAWQSGKLVFDEANAGLAPGDLATDYLARVTPALEARETPLALGSVPMSLEPAQGNVIVDGTLWRFKELPASLQERVYYDTISQKLGVRGLLNGRILGDGDLLAAPGAQTILQPNVLTAEDEARVAGLASGDAWTTAVSALGALSRDPESGGGIGLEPAPGGAAPANSFGPGLAVVTNPRLLQAGETGGYVTIAENDHPDAPDTPVAMHVIRIDTEKYRGSVAVLEPSNVFDEKVSLRHTADFGGEVADLWFEWVIREEDGNELDPPPAGGWTPLTSGLGKVDAQLAGAGATLITDNLIFCRYRHKDDASGWSEWAGAANSRPPDDYVAQLAPGWVKRVAAAVNLFDARYNDFRSNDAPATYTSALQQAGQRWEGPVAFNPDKDAVENVGLIELYQTVLDRAEAFTIEIAPGTDGVNTALLNAANRIAGLYTLMGNEAYADALDPTVGFSTVGGQFGNLAPTIHAFQNQTTGLLDEELTLLRGRAEHGARPAYNRLPWNFTNGPGEAAYVLNYGIEDLTEDGFLDDEDARRLYPQGHGDAWGHYTMALKGYYDLATKANFTWSPRSEKYNIDGVVLDIDYLDERAFAKTAAAKARCGAELVDLTYRQAYTDNPDGQWQGYQDTDADRAWGVFETAQRAGTGALYDWMLGNALLPAEDTTNTGIQKVDRTTVGELAAIAAEASKIQSKLDAADRGLNPAGLDPNVVPFDIDPALTDRGHHSPATHFEQVVSRAKDAAANTLRIFDHANEAATSLRQTEASSESLRQQAIDQDRSFRNRLVEIFGTPYDGTIGSGKAYPAGYNGPDLYLYAYMDRLSVGDDILDPTPAEIVRTQLVPGLRNLSADTNPFNSSNQSLADALGETVSNYFPGDLTLPTAPSGIIELDLPRAASSYALTAPGGWGERRSPGAIQAAIQELIQADWELRAAILYYTETADDFQALLRRFEIKSGIASDKIALVETATGQIGDKLTSAADYFTSYSALDAARNLALNLAEAVSEGIPETVGLSNDAGSPAVGVTLSAGAIADAALQAAIVPLQVLERRAEIDAQVMQLEMDAAQLTADVRSELVDLLDEIVQFVNGETDKQIPIITAIEKMRVASDRVRTVVREGQALIEERTVFNQRVASTTTQQRYEDYTFRVFHNEALRKYRSSFDLAARYAYLAGKAYQYELNLPDNHAANASPLLAGMLRERDLGEWSGGEPTLGAGGLAEHLAVLETNFETLKGQLGFNNPEAETNVMSVRRELAQIGLSSRVNVDWRTQLESWRVPDLWNYEYQSNGVNYGYVFRRYCRPFAPESAGSQPALVIPFTSEIAAGQNWFGNPVSGGDSAFNPSNFSTKIRAAGVRFDAYNNIALSQTPQAYLVPVGNDKMFLPDSPTLEHRSWQVVDQRIPAPIQISPGNLADPDWQPFSGSANGHFEDHRKFSSFRAYHDAGGWDLDEMVNNGRLVGRSVWNTQWVLIIPSASLLYDAGNPSAGIDTFIHGAPLPGFDQTTGAANRDQVGVRDIRVLLQTYSASGN